MVQPVTRFKESDSARSGPNENGRRHDPTVKG